MKKQNYTNNNRVMSQNIMFGYKTIYVLQLQLKTNHLINRFSHILNHIKLILYKM